MCVLHEIWKHKVAEYAFEDESQLNIQVVCSIKEGRISIKDDPHTCCLSSSHTDKTISLRA
jgi:hypothetical protein